MPSQTIHIPDEEYAYIRDTMAESDQTFSSRAAELIAKGKEAEEND